MTWELTNDRPIYAQLVEQIKLRILSGQYKPGEKLPSVRDLAAEAAVNPNTMQKALAELETLCLVYAQRTAGRFITEDNSMIESLKTEMAREQIRAFFGAMEKLGYTQEQTLELLRQTMEEEK